MMRRSAISAKRAGVRAASTAAAKPLFDKILVANRGEITVRIAKSAKKLGIKTVAIYSDPDANAMHVRLADEAICVGPAPSSKSYLNVPRILQAIESTGAQAVHPGYGFLSENASFVGELEARNVTFIGPSAYAMNALGDKIHSKELANKAGVRTVPGFVGEVPTVEDAVKIAREIGYPVMIKASAGGGGKGMRIAYTDEETRSGYVLSKAEAKNSFADDRILLEKYIEEPRHIEIQLIADKHGNVAPLPERDCTIQRRNQKVIEESPSSALDPVTRRAMQDQAASLARAVNYSSAGTVEFLVDKNKNFYFLEMNTRLQVEHPVTEMVTGLDLVDLMIRVAAGEKLPDHLCGDNRAPILGHAFESRVYAEDPFRGFLPSTGRLSKYVEPPAFEARDPYLSELRCDAGVTQGSEISMFYDPMICKLITHGDTRNQALDKMRAALDAYVVRGVGHNISFLRDLCAHPRFIEGRLTTAFIKEEYPQGFKGVQLNAGQKAQVVAGAAMMNVIRAYAGRQLSGRSEAAPPPAVSDVVVTLGVAFVGPDGKQVGPAPEHYGVKVQLEVPEGASPADVADAAGGETWSIAITPVGADGKPLPGGSPQVIRLANVDWSVDDPLMLAALPDAPASAPPSEHTLRLQHVERTPEGFKLLAYGATVDAYVRSPAAFALAGHMLPKHARDFSKVLVSPMPGTLVSVAVKDGQEVEEGQEVAVVEAMKMQNVLRAPKKGRVKKVAAAAGKTLAVDETIIEFE